jgi:hypothetical protein
MSASGNLISKTEGSKDGYTILSLVAASILYEFEEYLPEHLFVILTIGTDETPSTFAISNSISLKLIV